jgi:hypothetical protein
MILFEKKIIKYAWMSVHTLFIAQKNEKLSLGKKYIMM